MATREELKAYEQSEVIARFLAEFGFRNSILENFHTGKSPQSRTGNFSDVIVTTPDEAIPWDKISRLSDTEMRTLMLDVERSLARVCFAILLAEREGTLDQLVQAILERSFGKNGISWDIPEETWRERQAMWKAEHSNLGKQA